MNQHIERPLRKAGETLSLFYRSSQSYTEKHRYELLSDADTTVEAMLIASLQEIYPKDAIYSEEAGERAGASDTRWIIDPLDGTSSFIAGVPYFAISLAKEVNGVITEGYVFNPISDEFYAATAESGEALLNGKPIAVSDTDRVEDSLVGFGFSARMDAIQRYYNEWRYVFKNCRKGLPLIVPALTICNVARGRLDAFIDFGCSMEGQAAASLILKNTGGHITNYDGTNYDHTKKGMIASNGSASFVKSA